MSFQNVIISQFDSNDQLCEAITCSCYLPIFSGSKIPKYLNKKYLDGGLTNQLPIFDSATLKISPFSGKLKHICPQDKNFANLTLANENIFINKNNVIRGIQAITYQNQNVLDHYHNLGYQLTLQYFENLNKNMS